MDKRVQFDLKAGDFEVIVQGQPFIKTAGELHPEVAAYVAQIKPDPNLVYVLVNALGAEEYYGSNSNGDSFPEEGLSHEPAGWDAVPKTTEARKAFVESYIKNPTAYGDRFAHGYTTFYAANVFKHHQNSNPETSFGSIVLAVYNKNMHRVELIQALDKKKAEEVGAMNIIDRILAGEYPSTSMGTKVPFDECSYPGCAHLAKTKAEYCEHLKNMMGRVLENGYKVFARNTYPRFFDDSYVFVGADKISFVTAKLASALSHPDVVDAIIKKASQNKKATLAKGATITKQVMPDEPWAKAIPVVSRREPMLPSDLLDSVAGDPRRRIAGLLKNGIVLKPAEFQRIVLMAMGKHGLADRLWSERRIFNPDMYEGKGADQFPLDMAARSIGSDHVTDRSFFGPQLARRVMMMNALSRPGYEEIDSPELSPIASAYRSYRTAVIRRIPELEPVPSFLSQSVVPPEVTESLLLPLVYALFSDLKRPLIPDYRQVIRIMLIQG